jgi:hypothetical protein
MLALILYSDEKTTHWFSELSVKLEIINNFAGICRGFLGFGKEKSFDGNVTGKLVEFFNCVRRQKSKTFNH